MNKLVNPLIIILSMLLAFNLAFDLYEKTGDSDSTIRVVHDEDTVKNVMESQKNIDDRDSRISELEHAIKVHRGELATLKAKMPSVEYHIGNFKKDISSLTQWHDKLTTDLDRRFRYMTDKFEEFGGAINNYRDKFNALDTILFRHGVKIDKLEVDVLPWEDVKQRKQEDICVPPVEESSEGDSPS